MTNHIGNYGTRNRELLSPQTQTTLCDVGHVKWTGFSIEVINVTRNGSQYHVVWNIIVCVERNHVSCGENGLFASTKESLNIGMQRHNLWIGHNGS